MVIKLFEMILTTTMKVVLPLVTHWGLVLVSIVADVALVLGVCRCIDVLTSVLIVIWVAVRVESLAINIIQDILLLCHEILLLLLDRKIWFDIIVSCCGVCYPSSFKVMISLL